MVSHILVGTVGSGYFILTACGAPAAGEGVRVERLLSPGMEGEVGAVITMFTAGR